MISNPKWKVGKTLRVPYRIEPPTRSGDDGPSAAALSLSTVDNQDRVSYFDLHLFPQEIVADAIGGLILIFLARLVDAPWRKTSSRIRRMLSSPRVLRRTPSRRPARRIVADSDDGLGSESAAVFLKLTPSGSS